MPKKYGMIHDDNLCIGCQACSIACRAENKVPESVYRLQVHIKGPEKLPNGTLKYTYHRQSCVQCENTPCVSVCPTKASYKDENGIVSEEIYKKLLFDKLEVNKGMIMENIVAQMLVASGHKLYFYNNKVYKF